MAGIGSCLAVRSPTDPLAARLGSSPPLAPCRTHEEACRYCIRHFRPPCSVFPLPVRDLYGPRNGQTVGGEKAALNERNGVPGGDVNPGLIGNPFQGSRFNR